MTADRSVSPGQPRGNREALDRLLADPGLAWLVGRVRGRILAAGAGPLHGVVQLRDPSPEQRAAAWRLVGRPRRTGSTLRVDLSTVEEVLRRGPWPAGLADAVETVSGPVTDRRSEQERDAAAWRAAGAGLAGPAGRHPGLVARWDAWCAVGGLKRTARAEAARLGAEFSPAVAADLVNRLGAVLDGLPVADEPLAVLARRVLGDAHALDDARPLGRLAAAVVGAAFVPGVAITERDLSTRDAWAAAGVVLSNVASRVLCLGVPGADASGVGSLDIDVPGAGVEVTAAEVPGEKLGRSLRSATAASLEAMRAARAPLLLTLDQVRSGGVRALPPDAVVHVCENPTVVEVVAARWAAAGTSRPVPAPVGTDQRAAVGPVLVCTGGQPSTAVVDLLARLVARGAACRYHGDFDWGGLRIARSLGAHVDWVPWRFTAAHYREAVRAGKPSRHLAGRAAESPWDPELAVAMADDGFAVEEEAVADLLAADLLTDPSPAGAVR